LKVIFLFGKDDIGKVRMHCRYAAYAYICIVAVAAEAKARLPIL